MNNGYSICFNKWALDKNIKNELRLLIIISSLTAQNGYCFASNKFFSKLFNETEISISNKIKKLEKNDYIEIDYKKRGAEIIDRKIRLKNILIDDKKVFYSTIKKDFKDNNISINNTSINIKEKINKREKFEKPTIEEVKSYIQEKSLNVIAEAFIDYYDSNGWKVGKNQMKDWRATIRGWARREVKSSYQRKEKEPDWYGKQISEVQATEEEMQELEKRIKSL